ncbi:hypothetical protein ACODNH_02015 (plasmid) [Haloarcula sp. NS06]|uniref:hypothetical protein n=1 Tax=Haloarcula sp. NS06 TaxID=3409688 RepID=UPI003DA735F9
MDSGQVIAIVLAILMLLSGCSGLGGIGQNEPTQPESTEVYENPSEEPAPDTEINAATSTVTPTSVDSDDDGLNDRREAELGTDPNKADTDGDGLNDHREVTELKTDPTSADTDNDGLADAAELKRDTDPRNRDTDNDGLADGAEIEYGTDPSVRDTDGDNLLDGWEVHSDVYPDANPLHKDVYVEIDYMKSYSLPDEERALIKSKFADAPVSNPNGTNGIDLHLIRSEQVPYTRTLGGMQTDEYEEKYFDHNGQAYHYAILVDRSSLSGSVDGGGAVGIMHVSGTVDDTRMGTTFIHELGHSLGLVPDVYNGIDSTDVPFDEYPSVLNYNSPSDHYSYSSEAASDAGFDDWEYIEKKMYTPPTRLMPGPNALDQCVAVSFAGGDGSASDPYQIETLRQLECIGVDSDANYELVSDIDATWRTGFDPTLRFSGTLDGNGHTVRGLTVHRSGSAGGVVKTLNGGTIKRLHLRNVSVRGQDNVGGVASTSSGTITQVTVTGSVRGERRVGGVAGVVAEPNANYRVGEISAVEVNATVVGEYNVGGLAGNSIGNLTNSAVFGSVRGESEVGGLVGTNYAPGRVASSFSAATVSGEERVGGAVGRNYENGPVEDVYWNADAAGQSASAGSPTSNGLSADEMTGEAATENMSGFDFGGPWVTTDDYPVPDWLSERVTPEMHTSPF